MVMVQWRTDSKHYLELAGEPPVVCVNADWSVTLAGGVLCHKSPIVHDPANADGGQVWGPLAKGIVVVSCRGDVQFEDMARNAEKAGAVGLVVVDNEDIFEDDWVMTADALPYPRLPTVLVPKRLGARLCHGLGARSLSSGAPPSFGSGLTARIDERCEPALIEQDTLQAARIRGVRCGIVGVENWDSVGARAMKLLEEQLVAKEYPEMVPDEE